MSTLYYLIRTRDGAYWRPKGEGYTDKVSEAGKFTQDDAAVIISMSHGDVEMIEVGRASFTPLRAGYPASCSFRPALS